MAWAPQPVVADVVDPLGQYMLQEATDDRLGGQAHGLPPLVLGVLVAAADVAVREGENPAMRQREAVDRPAQGVQAWRWALRARLTVADPACGPERLGRGQVGAFLTHEREQQPAKALREGLDGPRGGRPGGAPRGPGGGAPSGRHQTVPLWRIDAGAGPRMEAAADAKEAADIMGVCGERDEGLGRGAAQDRVERLLRTTDALAPRLGHGEDHGTGGDRQAFWTPRCPPGFGLEAMPRGATTVAAGVVDVVCLPTVLARHQVPAEGRGATGDAVIHGTAVAGQKALAAARPRARARAPADVRHLWPAPAPTR